MKVDDTDFRLSRPSIGVDLPPIVLVVASGPWHLQTYWTPEQARDFALQLATMADTPEVAP
jgi:hypothetical protein